LVEYSNLMENKYFVDAVNAYKQACINIMVGSKDNEKELREQMHRHIKTIDIVVNNMQCLIKAKAQTKEEAEKIIRPSRFDRLRGKTI
jgi:hypothetical protein